VYTRIEDQDWTVVGQLHGIKKSVKRGIIKSRVRKSASMRVHGCIVVVGEGGSPTGYPMKRSSFLGLSIARETSEN
jgi:hypothetical protein